MLKCIKEAGKKAGITERCIVTEDRGATVTNTSVCKYELIGTHTGRRSFISNMLLRGYDSHIIMKVTGHKTESAFKKYAKISSEDAANLMLTYDLLFNSQESNIESYGIDRDVDISQFDLNKNEIDFLDRTMDSFDVGTPSLKVRKILNRLLELGIVVRLK